MNRFNTKPRFLGGNLILDGRWKEITPLSRCLGTTQPDMNHVAQVKPYPKTHPTIGHKHQRSAQNVFHHVVFCVHVCVCHFNPFQAFGLPGISSIIAAKSHSSCRSHHTRRPFVKGQELGSKLKFRWPKIKQAQKNSSRYHHSHSDWPSVRVSPNCQPNPQVLQDAIGTWARDIWLHTTWRKRFSGPMVSSWNTKKGSVSKPGIRQFMAVLVGKR